MLTIRKQLQKSVQELETLLGSVPKFQIVAGAIERKKDWMQFLEFKKKAHNLVITEESFEYNRQQCTPFLPTFTPIVLGF